MRTLSRIWRRPPIPYVPVHLGSHVLGESWLLYLQLLPWRMIKGSCQTGAIACRGTCTPNFWAWLRPIDDTRPPAMKWWIQKFFSSLSQWACFSSYPASNPGWAGCLCTNKLCPVRAKLLLDCLGLQQYVKGFLVLIKKIQIYKLEFKTSCQQWPTQVNVSGGIRFRASIGWSKQPWHWTAGSYMVF